MTINQKSNLNYFIFIFFFFFISYLLLLIIINVIIILVVKNVRYLEFFQIFHKALWFQSKIEILKKSEIRRIRKNQKNSYFWFIWNEVLHWKRTLWWKALKARSIQKVKKLRLIWLENFLITRYIAKWWKEKKRKWREEIAIIQRNNKCTSMN